MCAPLTVAGGRHQGPRAGSRDALGAGVAEARRRVGRDKPVRAPGSEGAEAHHVLAQVAAPRHATHGDLVRAQRVRGGRALHQPRLALEARAQARVAWAVCIGATGLGDLVCARGDLQEVAGHGHCAQADGGARAGVSKQRLKALLDGGAGCACTCIRAMHAARLHSPQSVCVRARLDLVVRPLSRMMADVRAASTTAHSHEKRWPYWVAGARFFATLLPPGQKKPSPHSTQAPALK